MDLTAKSCNFCITNQDEQLNIFEDHEIEQFISKLYRGDTDKFTLDLAYYLKVATKLTDGMFQGFGSNLTTVAFGSPDVAMLTSLRENIYVFSAAKTFQQTKVISSFLVSENGSLRTFSEFQKLARPEFDTYNRTYLTVEYNSAIAQGQAASRWQDIIRDKQVLKKLKYQTIGDERVRPTHAELDNIVRLVDDAFWDLFFPPNGWNCRCEALQVDEEVITPLRGRGRPTQESVPEIFRFNAGKTKQVYSKRHPYFKVKNSESTLKKQNFGLPLP